MDAQDFEKVLDLAPIDSAAARTLAAQADKEALTPADRTRLLAAADPKPIVQQPQLDATIIELDESGRPVQSATVLMSPKYTKGIVVPVDDNMYTDQVRWRDWDDEGWYTNKGQGTVDSIPGRENAPIDQMEIYPASVLKLMVNFGVFRLVDAGTISLDQTYDYQPTETSALCGGPTSKTIEQYIDESITWSSNGSSCALIKLLHDHQAIDGLNQTFNDMGLEMLQLRGTNPANGGRWQNVITMTSLDTAKLLALINGAPGTVWTAPNGQPVTSEVLSESSRQLFMAKLNDQGYNENLSTTNRCGAKYPTQGIPQRTPERWIAEDGTVTVNGLYYGRDVRPCNKKAEVTFAHKTGLVSNGGADAGIVKNLPGKDQRSYVVVVFSNLGDQYRDPTPPWQPTPSGVYPVAHTQKLAQFGLAIDRIGKECHRRGALSGQR